jgi:hypothetical protein
MNEEAGKKDKEGKIENDPSPLENENREKVKLE